jgi:predicted nucleic acid-binding protein
MDEPVFIDTNILIYAYSSTELDKKQLADKLLKTDVKISTQIVNEFIWVMTKKYNINAVKIKRIVKGLFFVYEVVLINQKIIEQALTIADRYNYSYWDSLVLSSALEADCSIIYSEDMQHGQVIEEKLKISNPFAIKT